jgi:hypothetical protein
MPHHREAVRDISRGLSVATPPETGSYNLATQKGSQSPMLRTNSEHHGAEVTKLLMPISKRCHG